MLLFKFCTLFKQMYKHRYGGKYDRNIAEQALGDSG